MHGKGNVPCDKCTDRGRAAAVVGHFGAVYSFHDRSVILLAGRWDGRHGRLGPRGLLRLVCFIGGSKEAVVSLSRGHVRR